MLQALANVIDLQCHNPVSVRFQMQKKPFKTWDVPVALHWPGAKSRRSQVMPTPSISCGGLEPFDKYFKIHASFFFFLFSLSFFSFHYHSHSGEPRQTDKSNNNATGCRQERKGCIYRGGWLLQQGRQHCFHGTGGKNTSIKGYVPQTGV